MADAEEIYRAYDPNRQGWKAPQSRYRPDVSALLSSNDDPDRVLRELAAESNALAKPQEPTVWDAFTTNPATHRRKLPGRAQADAQRQHFLDRALDIYGRPTEKSPAGEYLPPTAWSNSRLPEDIQRQMMDYATNKDGFRDNIAKPYEYTGWLGPGSRLNTAMRWLQAMPTGLYQGSHALANLTGDVAQIYTEYNNPSGPALHARGTPGYVKSYTQAYEDAADAGATLAGPLTWALGMDGMGMGAWSRMQAEREAWDDNPHEWLGGGLRALDDRPGQGAAVSAESHAAPVEDGEELLQSYKVDDLIGRLGTRVLGAVMDDTLNPFWDGGSIVKAARAGKMGPAWRGLALEHLPGVGMASYATYRENEADKILKRIEAAKNQDHR